MKGFWPVIKQLRAMFPEETWAYEPKRGFWVTKSGWYVYLSAPCLSEPEWAVGSYRRSDNLEVVFHRGMSPLV